MSKAQAQRSCCRSTSGFQLPAAALFAVKRLEKRIVETTMHTQNGAASAMEAQDILENMSDAVSALHYLATLLDVATNAESGVLADRRSGLSFLMEAQLSALTGGISTLRQYVQAPASVDERQLTEVIRQALATEASRPAWHDLDTIAARSRVHRSDVARVMFVLTGEDHESDAYHAWDGNPAAGVPAHLLTGLCWDTLTSGNLWGRVSDASGLSLAKVKEVLGFMIEFSPKRQEFEVPEAFKDQPFGELRAIQAEERSVRERVEARDADGPSEGALDSVRARLQEVDITKIAQELNISETDLQAVIEGLVTAKA